jgi:PAS domain S-box-containing protein
LVDNKLQNLIGKTATEVFKERPRILKYIRKCINKKETIDKEIEYEFTITGTSHFLRIKLVFIPPDIILGYHEDITRRKIAEQKIKESEKKLNAIIEQSPVAIGIFNAEGNLINCNKSMKKVTGYDESDLVGKNYQNFPIYPPGLSSVIHRYFQSSLKKEDLQPSEIQIKRKDKRDYWVISQISSFKYGDETFFQWILQDINELKKTQEALSQSKEEHKNIIDNLSDIVVKTTIDGNILYVSSQVERLLGYTQKEFKKLNVFEYVHPDDLSLYKKAFQRALKTGDLISLKFRIPKKNGQYLPVKAKGNLINDQGKLRLIGIVRDLSREEIAKEKIQKRLEFERLISKISTRFVGIVDFNNVIDLTIKDMAQFIHASRGYLFLFDENREVLNNTHEWCADKVKPQINEMQGIPIKSLKWWIKQLQTNSLIHITSPEDLKIFPSDQNEEQNIKSILAFPIYIKDELMGFLGFDDVKATMNWSLDDLELFRIPSELIGNILERKYAEETLKNSENLLKGIISIIPDYLSIVDTNFNIIWVNRQIRSLFNENPLNRKCYEMYHNRKTVCENCILVKTLKDGKSHEKEVLYQTKEGEKIFLNRTNILNRKPEGSHELILIAAQDITSLRESKEQLEINEKKYKSLFNNAGHPVLIIDIESQKIVDLNSTTQKLLGYKSEDLIDQKVEKIFVIDPEEREKHLNTLINKGKNYFKARIINKDGNIKEAFIMAELLVLRDHKYVQIVLGFSDKSFHKNFKKF